jgi:hypothetical protein
MSIIDHLMLDELPFRHRHYLSGASTEAKSGQREQHRLHRFHTAQFNTTRR